MTPDRTEAAGLAALAGLFYPDLAALGRFVPRSADKLPPAYRELLAHANHMTVTVERFHGSPVDVDVLDWRMEAEQYWRKILLRRQSDGRVVQFGIMRLSFACVSPDVRRIIESRSVPLGRILIEHGVLREIHLVQLWQIEPAEELRRFLDMPPGESTFGRTALIDFDGRPAVELLEIVSPVRV